MKTLPLVSCLCITRNRVTSLARAIRCFTSQTYPNKELLILCEEDDKTTINYLETLNIAGIRHVVIENRPKKKLGELRNISIDLCKGEYFCQWDDDDWYHCERIAKQFSAATENHHPGSILTNWIIFDEIHKQAYFSWIRWWEGSIFYKKDLLLNQKIQYPLLEKSEDTVFVQDIVNKSRLFPLVCPPIYIYTYHGKNTWQQTQFEHHFKLSQKLSGKISLLIETILKEKYSNQEASQLLAGPEIMEEINFFHALKTASAQNSVVYRNL